MILILMKEECSCERKWGVMPACLSQSLSRLPPHYNLLLLLQLRCKHLHLQWNIPPIRRTLEFQLTKLISWIGKIKKNLLGLKNLAGLKSADWSITCCPSGDLVSRQSLEGSLCHGHFLVCMCVGKDCTHHIFCWCVNQLIYSGKKGL